MPLHENASGHAVHVPHAFTYSDAAQRTAAFGFTGRDVGKLALQLDDWTHWSLTSAFPPTWKAFGGGGGGAATAVQFPNDVVLQQDGVNGVKLSKQVPLNGEPSIVFDLSPAATDELVTFSFANGPVSGTTRGLGLFGIGPLSLHPGNGAEGLHIIPEFLPLPMNPNGIADSYLYEFQQGMIDFHILRTDGQLVGDYPHLNAFFNDDEGRPEFGIGGDDFGILIRGFEAGWGTNRPSDYTFGRYGGAGSIRFSIPSEDTPLPRWVSIDSAGGQGADLRLTGWYEGRGVRATSFDTTPNTFVAWNNGTIGSTVQFPFFDLPDGGGRTSGIGVTQGETGDCANVDCFSLADLAGNSCRSEMSATAGAASFAFDFRAPLGIISRVYGRGDENVARIEVSSHIPTDPQTAYAALLADRTEGYGKLILTDVTPDGFGGHPSRTITVKDGYLSNTKPASKLNGCLVDPANTFTVPIAQGSGAVPFDAEYLVSAGVMMGSNGAAYQWWPGYGTLDYYEVAGVLTPGRPVLVPGEFVICVLALGSQSPPIALGNYTASIIQFWIKSALPPDDTFVVPMSTIQAASDAAMGGAGTEVAIIGVGVLMRNDDTTISNMVSGIYTAGPLWSRS